MHECTKVTTALESEGMTTKSGCMLMEIKNKRQWLDLNQQPRTYEGNDAMEFNAQQNLAFQTE